MIFKRNSISRQEKSAKELELLQKREERRKIYKYLVDLDIKTNLGVARGYITIEYTYLGKKYDNLGYKLISSTNIIIRNEDYEVIDVLTSYEYTKGLFNGLFLGNLEI